MKSNGPYCLLLSIVCVTMPGLVGCGDSGDGNAIVQGTVTIDGQLAKSGSVVFHPEGDGPAAYGTIRSDGSYALRVGRGNPNNVNASKIQSGEYVATVQILGPSTPDEEFEGAPPKPGPLLVADRYTKKASSELKHTIKAGRNVVNLELESPSEEELAARAAAAAAKAAEESEDDAPDAEDQPPAEEQPQDEEPAEEPAASEADQQDAKEEVES